MRSTRVAADAGDALTRAANRQAVAGSATQGDGGGLDSSARTHERRRMWMWLAFLGFSPLCLGVVAWAAVAWNGSYPTVPPPVPKGWKAVAGIYASFSVPKGWALQPGMADAQGDVYYSGSGGAAGEMVREATSPPKPARSVPSVVATFLGGHYNVVSVTPYRLRNAAVAWQYRFELSSGEQAVGVLAWVKPTQSQVWLVALPASATARRVLSTLTLAT